MRRGRRGGARLLAYCAPCVMIAPVLLGAMQQPQPWARAADAPAPFACDGPRDLIVEGGRLTLQGTRAYDRVCVQNGGILYTPWSLTLRVGALYVDSLSKIVANGQDGYLLTTHDCLQNEVVSQGGAGVTLTIVARRAVVRGRIEADGGHGLNNEADCGSSTGTDPIGDGGAAGTVLFEAQSLSLSGTISATGGAGGAATAAAYIAASSSRSGKGGKGGRVTMVLGRPPTRALRSSITVAGGKAGARGAGPTGAAGAPGTIKIRGFTPAERRTVPQPPAPLVTVAGLPPMHAPPDPRFVATRRMGCIDRGDLRVSSGDSIELTGRRQYHHVCVEKDGTLIAKGTLTLVAGTIAVAPDGLITADGTAAATARSPYSGRYEAAGPCRPTHAAPHAGTAGSTVPTDTAHPDGLEGIGTADPGNGGGVLTLIARSILLQGAISADGDTGQDGSFAPGDPNRRYYDQGGGGGSGGGIRLVAREIQLSGHVSAIGGAGV